MAIEMQRERAAVGEVPAAKTRNVPEFKLVVQTGGSKEQREEGWDRFRRAAVALMLAGDEHKAKREKEEVAEAR